MSKNKNNLAEFDWVMYNNHAYQVESVAEDKVRLHGRCNPVNVESVRLIRLTEDILLGMGWCRYEHEALKQDFWYYEGLELYDVPGISYYVKVSGRKAVISSVSDLQAIMRMSGLCKEANAMKVEKLY